MEQALKEKLETVVALVDSVMIDPDIDVEYCIPGVEMTSDSCDISGYPYIMIRYSEDEYFERKISLADKHLRYSAEEVANLVTFTVEQFKEEVDSLKYGAQ